MGWGRGTETERMPNLVGGGFGDGGGKPKNRNSFSKPNTELLPNQTYLVSGTTGCSVQSILGSTHAM
jgi:hypothetical protein